MALPLAGDGGPPGLQIGDPRIEGGRATRVGRRFGGSAELLGGGHGPVHVATPEQAAQRAQEAHPRQLVAADLRGDLVTAVVQMVPV